MNRSDRLVALALLVLLIATIAGLVLTSRPIVEPRTRPAYRNEPFYRLIIAAQDQFDTARRLVPRAESPEEQWIAREVLRLADTEVDLAFANALREASEHPAALSAEAQAVSERLKSAQAQLEADQADLQRMNKAIAGAKDGAGGALAERLQLVKAQVDLDQDEVDDAHRDLIRAGGDPQGIIQRMKQRYEAREQAAGGLQGLVPPVRQDSVESTQSRNIVALARAWYSLHGKRGQLQQAEKDVRAELAAMTTSHADLDAHSGAGAAGISSVKKRDADRKNLIVIDKRIENKTQLAETYGRWSAVVQERERQCVHRLLTCLFLILIIAAVTTAADVWIRRASAHMAADRTQVRTFHSVAGYVTRGAGGVLVLLVVFGPPTQFAAVLALAGAGLTVALKDFIVAFIGWFVLIGRNGIRAGDWVEINGVSGEVLEVGPMRTILLETGNWSDAGHPTGRKIAFMNGFAVEGHYFNFSTSGQWMWDEIQLTLSADADPFATADAVSQIVAAETRKNAALAAAEWRRVAPNAAPEAFRGEPVMSVRPTGSGANLLIRYVTRANERYELRSRLYRALIDLQRGKPAARPEPDGEAR